MFIADLQNLTIRDGSRAQAFPLLFADEFSLDELIPPNSDDPPSAAAKRFRVLIPPTRHTFYLLKG
jgi:hypothetical protein